MYLAPAAGSGVMERIGGVAVPAATGADATAGRIILRGYENAYEWDVQPGDTLAGALGRSSTPVVLPETVQGEAIAYARDGSGLWTTSERQASPVHFLAPEPPPTSSAPASTPTQPPPASAGDTSGEPGASRRDRSLGPVLATAAVVLLVGLVIVRSAANRSGRSSAGGE